MLRAVIVLAGGSSRRLGRDKMEVRLGASTVLALLLDGVASEFPHIPVIAVGPVRQTPGSVTWVREDPPGGGPVSGLARGLDELASRLEGPVRLEDLVAVLAGDLPFAAGAARVLAFAATALPAAADGAVAVDADGRDQPLLGIYRFGPLRAAIGSEVAGRSVRSVLALLRVERVDVPTGSTMDVDTDDDIRAARRALDHG